MNNETRRLARRKQSVEKKKIVSSQTTRGAKDSNIIRVSTGNAGHHVVSTDELGAQARAPGRSVLGFNAVLLFANFFIGRPSAT